MSKHILIAISILVFFAPQIHSQTKPSELALAQRAAAEGESVVSAGPNEITARMQQQMIARVVLQRQL